MKNKITFISLAVLAASACTVNAVLVFEDTFSSFTPTDNPGNPDAIFDDNLGGGLTMQWLNSNNTSHFASSGATGDGAVAINTNSEGQTRGVAYVWDPTQMGGALVASAYTLEVDIFSQYNVGTLEVSVFEGVRDDTGTLNTYNLDLLSGVNQDLTHTTTGTGALTLLDSDSWSVGGGTSNPGTLTLNFNYDGTDDIVLVMNQRTTANFNKQTVVDAVRLSNAVIPEPSSAALMGAGAFALVFFARRRRS